MELTTIKEMINSSDKVKQLNFAVIHFYKNIQII